MKLNLRLHTYHLHYVYGQWAVGVTPVFLEVDLPHPGEGAINLTPVQVLPPVFGVLLLHTPIFRVGQECPVREVCVEFLHHGTELVSILVHAGSLVPEEVQIRSLVGWLIEADALDLVQADDSGDALAILLGQNSIPFERIEGFDVVSEISKISSNELLGEGSIVLMFQVFLDVKIGNPILGSPLFKYFLRLETIGAHVL